MRFCGDRLLDVHSNELSGSLPTLLNALSALPLSYLDVSENNFDGSIPSSITQLTSLTYLDFSGNMLHMATFPAFLTSIPAINNLDLSGAGIIGTIPSSISALTQLTNLDLSNNHLTGSIPSTVQAIPTLQYEARVAMTAVTMAGSLCELHRACIKYHCWRTACVCSDYLVQVHRLAQQPAEWVHPERAVHINGIVVFEPELELTDGHSSVDDLYVDGVDAA